MSAKASQRLDPGLAGSSPTSADAHLQPGNDEDGAPVATENQNLPSTRDVIHIFQCPRCRHPLRSAVTLPCGRQICRQCLPEGSHELTRAPHGGGSAGGARGGSVILGFECPLPECAQEHPVADCNLDVTVNKFLGIVRDEIAAADKTASAIATAFAQGSSSSGGRAAENGSATYPSPTLREDGITTGSPRPPPSPPTTAADRKLLLALLPALRTEADCQVCYGILLEPLTTSCGHTFCRACLYRVLDHSDHCPACRARLSRAQLAQPDLREPNATLAAATARFWPDEVRARRERESAVHGGGDGDAAADGGDGGETTTTVPIFVCTLSFPSMPTFLHVFEPRYRLMLRRCLDSDRKFGMVLPRSTASLPPGTPPFFEVGTLLRIVNVEFLHDGRSLIETVGVDRFRVADHWLADGGYVVGRIARYPDMDPAAERAAAAAEVAEWRARLAAATAASAGEEIGEVGVGGSGSDAEGASSAATVSAEGLLPPVQGLGRHGASSSASSALVMGPPDAGAGGAGGGGGFRWALHPGRASAMTTAELLAFCVAYVQASQHASAAADDAPGGFGGDGLAAAPQQQQRDGDEAPLLPPPPPPMPAHSSFDRPPVPGSEAAGAHQGQPQPVSASTGRAWLTPRLEAMYGRCPTSPAAAARLQRMWERSMAAAAAEAEARAEGRRAPGGLGSGGDGGGGGYDLDAAAAAAVVRQRVGEAASIFAWWFASVFPGMDEAARYAMLCCRSRRDRLKLCVGWIAAWVRRPRWSISDCHVS